MTRDGEAAVSIEKALVESSTQDGQVFLFSGSVGDVFCLWAMLASCSKIA